MTTLLPALGDVRSPVATFSFDLPKSMRRQTRRSYGACSACKARKIKCDESKPQCRRCREKGRVCPGYPQPVLKWSRKHEINDNIKGPESARRREPFEIRSTKHLSPVLSPSPPFEIPGIDTAGTNFSPLSFCGMRRGNHSKDLLSPMHIDASSPNVRLVDFWSDNTADEDASALFMTSLPAPLWPGATPMHEAVSAAASPVDILSTPEIGDAGISFSVSSLESLRDFPIYTYGSPPGKSQPPTSSQASASPDDTTDSTSSLPRQLTEIRAKLVKAYFSVVCPVFSTFDSLENPFRSFVHRRWQDSAVIYYTIMSMSAAKLGWTMSIYKTYASDLQAQALQHLRRELSTADSWCAETVLVVLLLGLSSPWHDTCNLGLAHLNAMRNVVESSKVQSLNSEIGLAGFLQQALVYWEMITSFIPGTCTLDQECWPPQNVPNKPGDCCIRVKPHPWTGIAAEPQALFTRLMRLAHTRNDRDDRSSTKAFSLATNLEDDMWLLRLPGLHEIAASGDEKSSSVHFRLLAEAYMFANFHQFYQNYPRLWRRRLKKICSESADPDSTACWMYTHFNTKRALADQYALLEDWLSFLGQNIIVRLEQIPLTSGTSCVQPLLLLVGSTALSVSPGADPEEKVQETMHLREVVFDRLTYFTRAFYSEPVANVTKVVLDNFSRLDSGLEVFWTYSLQSMGLITIIG